LPVYDKILNIEYPAIKSAGLYYFNTPSGLRYEVRFGRKKDQPLCATIVFGVVNNVYSDEEYKLTNRGEVWQVMNTIVHVVAAFREQHPGICSYEIYALEKEDENEDETGSRMNLYARFIPRLFNEGWITQIENNKATVIKKEFLNFYTSQKTALEGSSSFTTPAGLSAHLKNLFGFAN
jgi:hypothetical protein